MNNAKDVPLYYAGIDLGGTTVCVGMVESNTGRLVVSRKANTGLPCQPDSLVRRIQSLVRETAGEAGIRKEQILSVGIGVPGNVNKKRGTIVYANNLDYRDVPIVKLLSAALDMPVYLENDANAAAWGEYCMGLGQKADSMVMVTLGTGVGGGIIEQGRIVDGCNGAAGELGHFVMVYDGIACSCGMRGCFEQYGSVTALIGQTKEAMYKTKESLLWEICGQDVTKVSGYTAFEGAKRKDCTAMEVVETWLRYVSTGITGIINIFNPAVLCIGGGISREGETLLGPVREFVQSHSYDRESSVRTQIQAAVLAEDAGMIGAALLCRKETHTNIQLTD